MEEGPPLAMLTPWARTPSLQSCEEELSIVYKLLGLWYFVIVAQMD